MPNTSNNYSIPSDYFIEYLRNHPNKKLSSYISERMSIKKISFWHDKNGAKFEFDIEINEFM
uniref:hypothetical protein n=1 Tax=Wolbachia endosymbiont of Pentidionis agamae TaxID=3110435 RepID=UPI002FD47C3C